MTNYQKAKQQLKNAANLIKQTNPTDKPMVRQYINDVADSIIKDIILKMRHVTNMDFTRLQNGKNF